MPGSLRSPPALESSCESRLLAEFAENACFSLELARKGVAHLGYTHRTLFAKKIDLDWVISLPCRDDLAEKIDAFVSRFGRLQDHLGEKLIPRFAALVGESPKTMIDTLAFAERAGWLDDAEVFFGARKLRNLLVPEYLSDPALFLEALKSAEGATHMLLGVVDAISSYARTIGLIRE